MTERRELARRCLAAADEGTMTFPEIVGTLAGAGFESYTIDFRRATATYYLPDGDSMELAARPIDVPVAAEFDAAEIAAAIGDAQRLAPGYSYPGFCNRVAAAGCACYTVSIIGRRALYVGRTADTHTERFPD